MELKKFHGIFLCFLKDEIREQIKAEIYERNNSDQDSSVNLPSERKLRNGAKWIGWKHY